MILPVGEDAASSREHRARLALCQGENEAADACVWNRRGEAGNLRPIRKGALHILDKVPYGGTHVSAVAHHQSVDRHAVEAVICQPAVGSI